MKAVEEFDQSLRGFLLIVGQLEGSAHRLKNAFLANDILEIEQARLDQEKLLVNLDQARSSYRSALDELSKSLNPSTGDDVDQWLSQRPELAQVAELWADLMAAFSSLCEITKTNRLLATRGLAFYRKLTFMIQPDRKAQTYADSGRLQDQASSVISHVI